MTWFKVDDTSAFNAKVMAAGNEAWGAFCRVGAWCAQQLSDGRFSRAIAVTIAPMKVWEKLASVGLVDKLENGEMQMHDYLQRNPSKAQVIAERDATRLRVNTYRNGKRNAVTNDSRHAEVPVGSGREDLIPDPDVSEPYSQTIQIAPNVVLHTSSDLCERIWEELWAAKYKRKYIWLTDTGAKGDVRSLQDVWLMAMEVSTTTEPVFRHWVRSYLRDPEPYVANKNHPAFGLKQRVNQYGLPPKAKQPREREPESEEQAMDPAAVAAFLTDFGKVKTG